MSLRRNSSTMLSVTEGGAMKTLLAKMAVATGMLFGGQVSGPTLQLAPLPKPLAVRSATPQAARSVPAKAAPRKAVPVSLEVRALKKTAGDAQARMRLILAEFGEGEGVLLEDAMSRHPDLQAKLIAAFAAPEVREFAVGPDGALTMTVKRL